MIAFKETAKAYPNYGKKTDMGAEQWWTEVCDIFVCSLVLNSCLILVPSYAFRS